MTDVLGDFRAPEGLIRRYHPAGLWRDQGPIADLRHWAMREPGATAIIQYRGGVEAERLTYGQYAARVERFAAALHSLGVREGDVVAVWLPNFWQVSALMLACARSGAVTAPIRPTIRTRELERIFARLAPKVCVTVDEWAGSATPRRWRGFRSSTASSWATHMARKSTFGTISNVRPGK